MIRFKFRVPGFKLVFFSLIAKLFVQEFPFLSFPLAPPSLPFAGERERVRGLNLKL
jgi:hypothetical protein